MKTKITIIVLLAFLGLSNLSSAQCQVTLDNYTNVNESSISGNNIVFTHTCNGTDRYLIISVSLNGLSVDTANVTYGGQHVPLIYYYNPSGFFTFGLVNPHSGTNTVNIPLINLNPPLLVATAISFNSVDQLNPIDGTAHGYTAGNSSNSLATQVNCSLTTNFSNTYVFDIISNQVSNQSSVIQTPDSGQSIIWANGSSSMNYNTSYFTSYSSKIQATPGVVSDGWTWNNSNSWYIATSDYVMGLKAASSFNLAISSQTNASCYGVHDGSATVSVTSGTPPFSYNWNTNPVQTTATAINLGAGIYTVTVIDSLGCTNTLNDTITQPPHPNYNLNFTAPQQLLNWPNFTAQFNNTTPNLSNYNFTWDFGDGTILGSNGPTVFHTYHCNGLYTITLIAVDTATGCSDTLVRNDWIDCQGGPNPTIPTITLVNNYLQSSIAASYQWYLNGNIINGATSQTYTPLQNGNYTVIVTDTNGCTYVSSAVFDFTTVGITEIKKDNSISIYPNPANTVLNIRILSSTQNQVLLISDIFGNQIYNKPLPNSINIVDVSKWDNGIYFYQIKNDKETIQGKFVVQK
jgi:hypothetical protein